MDNCANTYILNSYLQEQENEEKLQNCFDADIQNEIEDIEIAIAKIKARAKDYEGNDMSDYAEDLIKDLI